MNKDVVVSIRNVSKSFRMYGSPIEWLKEALHPFNRKYHREFRALNDVSFEVRRGESIGIIGRNGAGKSTLLQILCGIMQPAEGEVIVNGKVAALLELGAGFSPEFTGRENVYLNGAIMGFEKKEMDGRFQTIADFADIGAFIDQPVRTYSSGMYVRLAFSCAVNVEPDILVVDEALAVGDLNFQAKCLKKIHDLQKRGVALIFVSHNMVSVTYTCTKGLFLEKGEVRAYGDVHDVVHAYTRNESEKNFRLSRKEGESSGDGNCVAIRRFSVEHATDQGKKTIKPGDSIKICCDFESKIDIKKVAATLIIFGPDDKWIGLLQSHNDGITADFSEGSHGIDLFIDKLALEPGRYKLQMRIASVYEGQPFIVDSDPIPMDVVGDYVNGIVHLERKWEFRNGLVVKLDKEAVRDK